MGMVDLIVKIGNHIRTYFVSKYKIGAITKLIGFNFNYYDFISEIKNDLYMVKWKDSTYSFPNYFIQHYNADAYDKFESDIITDIFYE